jgi:hypothetical protein
MIDIALFLQIADVIIGIIGLAIAAYAVIVSEQKK